MSTVYSMMHNNYFNNLFYVMTPLKEVKLNDGKKKKELTQNGFLTEPPSLSSFYPDNDSRKP